MLKNSPVKPQLRLIAPNGVTVNERLLNPDVSTAVKRQPAISFIYPHSHYDGADGDYQLKVHAYLFGFK